MIILSKVSFFSCNKKFDLQYIISIFFFNTKEILIKIVFFYLRFSDNFYSLVSLDKASPIFIAPVSPISFLLLLKNDLIN